MHGTRAGMPDLSSFDLTEILTSPFGRIGIGVLVVLVGSSILWKLWKWFRPPKTDEGPESAPIIRFESRPEKHFGLSVHVRNLRSRLAAVVVAPLDSRTIVPSVEQVPGLVDKFVPGLSRAIEEHNSIVKVWPRQYSNAGFGHALVRHVQIPDDEWRGSHWCLVSGPAFLREQRCVIGFVIVADSPNNMDLIRVESDGEWTNVLRVADS